MDLLGLDQVDRVLDAGSHVIRRQVGVVVADDTIEWHPCLHELEHGVDRNACPGNTRLTEMDLWIDNNPSSLHLSASSTPEPIVPYAAPPLIPRGARKQMPTRAPPARRQYRTGKAAGRGLKPAPCLSSGAGDGI